MAQVLDPKLATSINLFNLFRPSSTAARICAGLVVALVITYFFIRYQYPCRSPSSLMQIIDQASELFDKCLYTHAFQEGEYDGFKVSLQRITSRASEIAYRTRLEESDLPRRSLIFNFFRDYLEKASFSWERLKDIVACHREAQMLIRGLETCLMRASHSCAEYELQRVRRGVP